MPLLYPVWQRFARLGGACRRAKEKTRALRIRGSGAVGHDLGFWGIDIAAAINL